MKNKELPCEQCISLAICRHKSYLALFWDCSLLRIYEPRYQELTGRNEDLILKLVSVLEPTLWSFKPEKVWDDIYVVRDKNSKFYNHRANVITDTTNLERK